jgi:F-type H+-transporting ATPase subunit epsilon
VTYKKALLAIYQCRVRLRCETTESSEGAGRGAEIAMAKNPEPGLEERAASSGHKKLQVVVVTQEKTLLDEPVDFVSLPLYDGELGVLPGRTPLIGRLGYGELRTRLGETTHRYYVDGGFAQIRDDVVTVLTSRALTLEAVDPAAAVRELEKAQERPAVSDLDFAEKAKAVARARAMVRVGKHKG